MKKILFALVLLISKVAVAEELSISYINLFENGNAVSNQICEQKECTLNSSKSINYLVNITDKNGDKFYDKEINLLSVQSKILTQDEKQILEINYHEKTTIGYFNKYDELNIFFSMDRKSEKSSIKKTFYLPIKANKIYKINLSEDKSIDIKLN